MKARIVSGKIIKYPTLPNSFKIGGVVIENFSKASNDVLESYGFYDIVIPNYDSKTEYIHNLRTIDDYKDSEGNTKTVFTYDVSKISTAELKRDILVYARNNPSEFLNIIEDPMLKHEAKVKEFFEKGMLIEKSNGHVHYNIKGNKKRMLIVPNDTKTLLAVATYLQSDEGIESLKVLEKLADSDK